VRIKAKPKKKKRVYMKTPNGPMRVDGKVDNPRSKFHGQPRANRHQYLAERDMRRRGR
jgi:hypothetical protein